MKKLMLFVLSTQMVLAGTAGAVTLEEYLKQVSQKNRLISSYDIAIEASNERRIGGDLTLSPVLTGDYSKTSDKSLPSSVADKRDTTTLGLGVSKKFSSGTLLGVTARTNKYEYDTPVTPGNAGYSTGGLGVSLQQSLWKDFFGAGIRLRQDRDLATNRYEIYSLELRKRNELIKAEANFWDYIVALEDLKLKQTNLDRAKKLQSWTSNRVSNGISDDSDLLQIKALAARRELEMSLANDELQTQALKVRENLGLSDTDPLPDLQASLTEARPYVSDMAKRLNIIKIEFYLNSLEAQLKQKVAEGIVDDLRPDLALIGKYNTSSYDLDYGTMQSNIAKTDRPVTFLGVSMSWMFDTDAKRSQISSAKKEALSAQYRAEQTRLIGQDAWKEFLRKYEVSKQNVSTLEKIAQLQSARSKSEQMKFSKGRTITLNVVTAETDSAEAEVAYLKARSALRKLEADTMLFTTIEE